jgi:hypothetical protein
MNPSEEAVESRAVEGALSSEELDNSALGPERGTATSMMSICFALNKQKTAGERIGKYLN